MAASLQRGAMQRGNPTHCQRVLAVKSIPSTVLSCSISGGHPTSTQPNAHTACLLNNPANTGNTVEVTRQLQVMTAIPRHAVSCACPGAWR
jgi:hypothetical protein